MGVKYIRSVIVFFMIFFLCGCGDAQQDKQQEKRIIAMSMIGETHNWPVAVAYYAEKEIKAVAEENGWEYRFEIAKDTNEQSDEVIKLVNEGVDCIVMLPMDGASLKTAAMVVQDAGIPLVIFDREIPDFAPAATVKGDNTGIGTMTAEIFNEQFPGGTKVLEILGDTSTVPQQRTDGFDETISGDFTKEQIGYTGWQRKDSAKLFREWIEKNPQEEIDKVGAIFTHDDEIALGILDVLDEYKANPTAAKSFTNLKVIAGSAGSQEMYRRILNEPDYYLFSLTYSPAMVEKAIRTAECIIKGEDYEEMTIIETIEVNKENAGEFLDENSPF